MELYQVCTGRAWGGGGAGKGVARWSYTRCVQEGHGVVVVLVKGWPGGVVCCGHNIIVFSADDNSRSPSTGARCCQTGCQSDEEQVHQHNGRSVRVTMAMGIYVA